MPDEKETTATMWEDRHAGKRGHQLMTQKLAETIPAIYANEKVAAYDTVLAHAKLFSPYSNWTWFITEMDPETGQCFGLVEGFERELGYFDLTELAETTVFGGVPAVERDLYWQPRTMGEIKSGSREGSAHDGEIREGDTMTDETATEDQSQDVVNVEEFLFGGVTEETADGAPADAEIAEVDADAEIAAEAEVDGASTGAEAADGAGDLETAGEPDVADDAGEQSAPGETETTEQDRQGEGAEDTQQPEVAGEEAGAAGTEASDELKVVLSIRGNRATIGVKRPSADPHIESFDDPDLFGLADEFPAVVARAQAIWEEDPMHPAYVKPTPAPRQRNRRQQGTAQDAIAETQEAETQQQTLRLF